MDVLDRVGLPTRISDLLLNFAGRVDDDALVEAREFLAVAELGRAIELLLGTLAAGPVPIAVAERDELARFADRLLLDERMLDRLALSDRMYAQHRFTSGSMGDPAPEDGVLQAVSTVLRVLPDVRGLWCVWRTTPAGAVPGPVPQRVVLIEVGPAGFAPSTAYRSERALRQAGIRAVVEVLRSGGVLPRYHEEALAAARAVPLGSTLPARGTESSRAIGAGHVGQPGPPSSAGSVSRPEPGPFDKPQYEAPQYEAPQYEAQQYEAQQYEAGRFDPAPFDAGRFDSARFTGGPSAAGSGQVAQDTTTGTEPAATGTAHAGTAADSAGSDSRHSLQTPFRPAPFGESQRVTPPRPFSATAQPSVVQAPAGATPMDTPVTAGGSGHRAPVDPGGTEPAAFVAAEPDSPAGQAGSDDGTTATVTELPIVTAAAAERPPSAGPSSSAPQVAGTPAGAGFAPPAETPADPAPDGSHSTAEPGYLPAPFSAEPTQRYDPPGSAGGTSGWRVARPQASQNPTVPGADAGPQNASTAQPAAGFQPAIPDDAGLNQRELGLLRQLHEELSRREQAETGTSSGEQRPPDQRPPDQRPIEQRRTELPSAGGTNWMPAPDQRPPFNSNVNGNQHRPGTTY